MSVMLKVCDETTSGEKGPEFTIDFLTETISVRDLIRTRVYQEVSDYNSRRQRGRSEVYRGLVQPREAEKVLGGYQLPRERVLDWNEQCDAACDAFSSGKILVLVDVRLAEALEETITVRADTRVSFLKLVPLVGG